MAQVELVNVRGSRVLPGLPSWLAFTQGNIWHVKPYSGSDSNKGDRPDRALKTLSQAQTLATADQNDIVLLYSESNTAASTTDYQSATLDWAKDGVHLIGINSGSGWSQRSRVALISTYATASNLFTLSADNCYIANVQFFAGVADTNPTGCFKMTGDRNVVENCHIAGIGNDNNDIAGAYSLFLDGVEEATFRGCKIGTTNTAAGTAANSEILFDTDCKNIEFKDCLIHRRVEHATNHPLVKFADATSMAEFIMFDQCKFIQTATNYGVTASSVFKFGATPTAGLVLLYYPMGVNDNAAGAGKWDVDDLDKICVIGSATPAADSCGLIRVV